MLFRSAVRRVDHRLGRVELDRHRLLDQHALLGLERQAGVLRVPTVRRRDVHEVDAGAAAHARRVVGGLGVGEVGVEEIGRASCRERV